MSERRSGGDAERGQVLGGESGTDQPGQTDGDLTFTVSDDGVGLDPVAARGSDLPNMRDRLEALRGKRWRSIRRPGPGRR